MGYNSHGGHSKEMEVIKKVADIAVYAPDNTLKLVVEVKNRPGASSRWAARMLRNLLVHGMIADAPYYLLALPDVFYLWKNPNLSAPNSRDYNGDEVEPDFEIDAAEALAPYLERTPFSPDDVSEYGLELLISSWLTDLVDDPGLSKGTAAPDLGWLFDSGLYEAIRGGRVATEVAV